METLIGLFCAAVWFGTPLLFGTTGEILTEKGGSLNLGVEGTMAVGAIGGFLFATSSDSLFVGLIGGFLFGALVGLLFAFLTVTLKANQNTTGLAITIFGGGFCYFIAQTMKTKGTYPILSNKLQQQIANNGIAGLRDIPVIGKLFFSYNAFVYLAIAIAIVVWIYMFRTKSGLRLRAIGENPSAADSVGTNTSLYKYISIMIGSGIMGLGGMYMCFIINSGLWSNGWINGYGWIAVALVIFANWSSVRAIGGSLLFGLFLALESRMGNLAEAFPSVFGWTSAIPGEFFKALPFIMTVIVIVLSSMRKKSNSACPNALGINYYREDR